MEYTHTHTDASYELKNIKHSPDNLNLITYDLPVSPETQSEALINTVNVKSYVLTLYYIVLW